MSSSSFEHTLRAKGSVKSRRWAPGRDARRCGGRAVRRGAAAGSSALAPWCGAARGGAELPAAFPSGCRPLAGCGAGAGELQATFVL